MSWGNISPTNPTLLFEGTGVWCFLYDENLDGVRQLRFLVSHLLSGTKGVTCHLADLFEEVASLDIEGISQGNLKPELVLCMVSTPPICPSTQEF
jgi:hypothetical protein